MSENLMMKSLLLFAVYIVCLNASAVPQVPGDNTGYVEGESRYIWFPDGHGVPQLVDLKEPVNEEVLNDPTRNGANNAYWLFTRQNPKVPQILVNGNLNSILTSNYRSNRETKVIVHGWNNDGNSDVNPLITEAFLANNDVNVIVVDWSSLANGGYTQAVFGVASVGQHLGTFLNWLYNTVGGSWGRTHLVGFSLGAHIVGNAGRTVGGRCARVTGLDPAGPLWESNSNRLNSNDGVYVEAIHTDGGGLGLLQPIANADFYPNGGTSPQPGCWTSSCSHGRAYMFFASTVTNNHLVGRRCNNINDAQNGRCEGVQLNMGNTILNKFGTGLFGLNTGASWPF